MHTLQCLFALKILFSLSKFVPMFYNVWYRVCISFVVVVIVSRLYVRARGNKQNFLCKYKTEINAPKWVAFKIFSLSWLLSLNRKLFLHFFLLLRFFLLIWTTTVSARVCVLSLYFSMCMYLYEMCVWVCVYSDGTYVCCVCVCVCAFSLSQFIQFIIIMIFPFITIILRLIPCSIWTYV